jgi:hypothetical protein
VRSDKPRANGIAVSVLIHYHFAPDSGFIVIAKCVGFSFAARLFVKRRTKREYTPVLLPRLVVKEDDRGIA